jgi:hypothetical protein
VGLATLVFWNFGVGTRLASLAGAGRAFRLLSSLSAFLFLPALVIALLASSAAGARVLGPLAWLWPLTAVAMTGQAAWAMVGGGRGALGALPLLALNVLVAWAAAVRWIESLGGVLAPWTFAPGMAVATVLTAGAGATTYPWIAAVLVPALAPATPARSRRTRAARVAVSLLCAALLTATGFAFPSALDSLRAAATLRTNAPAPREGDELAVGLRVFGTLSGAPSGALARQDLSLADSIGATALHLEFSADGATTAALDSVARALEARRDSVRLIVTLDLGSTLARGRGSEGARQQRMALIERVVRRLRPDVLVPAARTALSGNADLTWWQTYYGQVAATVRRANRSVAVALPVTSASAADSTLAEWVLQGSSELAALAVTAQTADTPRQFAATLHAVARWASFARDAPMVWVLGTPSAPAATGEVVHQRVVRFALDWSAAHPWVRGVIAGDASDGLTPVGLRTATGRPRRALEEVRTVLRLRRDMPPALIDPRAAPSPDTPPAPTVRSPADSLPVPSP